MCGYVVIIWCMQYSTAYLLQDICETGSGGRSPLDQDQALAEIGLVERISFETAANKCMNHRRHVSVLGS